MRVLVTGGGGYIGAVLCEQLVAAGHRPVVLDRFFWGQERVAHLDIERIAGDVREIRDEWLDGIDAVAAPRRPLERSDRGVQHRGELADERRRYGTLVAPASRSSIERLHLRVERLVYDTGVLGDELDRSPIMCDEETVLAPRGAYSISKVHAEKAILAAADENFAPVIFRQGTVYG